MTAKIKARPGNEESEREIDDRSDNNKTGSDTDNDLDMGSDTLIHNETLMTSGSPTLVYLANLTKITAGNQDPNTENLFQQLLIQHTRRQQQNETLMTQMIQKLLSSDGTSPRRDPLTNYGHKLPVPK